uniref:7TM_GPCR_Srx domain-containing protein n=1 Tax=Meloidogyne hapla TaxID=6305 RepID=A0A1I8B4W8_MELHA
MVNKEEAIPLVRIFGAISYLIFTIFSLTMNILLAITLLKGWKHFRKNAFYRIVWQLIFADLFAQIVQLIVAVPTTFAGQKWGYYASTYLPAAMLLAYLAIYIRVRYFVNANLFKMSSMEKERKKREKKVLLQAFLICGFLELQDLAFIYIPKIPVEGQWSYLLTFTINWSGILLNSMSPIILFTFNKEISERIKKLIGGIIPQRFSTVTPVHTIQPTAIQPAQQKIKHWSQKWLQPINLNIKEEPEFDRFIFTGVINGQLGNQAK